MQKRQIPLEEFALTEQRYHNQLKRCQNDGYIAEICNRDSLHVCWSYQRFFTDRKPLVHRSYQ